ncbi:hypothetical protein ZWY2020_047370 [Hordeum vulgare]|nr:hypothetical protein ZWY2020_047370 [Hordeum vulgare]
MAVVVAAGGGDAAPAHRRLGGYLRAVVSVPAADSKSLRPLSPCPLSDCAPLPDDAAGGRAGLAPRGPAKWRATGGGGTSVVRHLRALVAARCVEVEGRVLRVVTRGAEEEARAVVLVDVYLPVAAWSGWQFPRSRSSAAAAVFNHLSCNWDARNALLAFDWTSHDNPHSDDQYIWNCTDCHVLGCELHQIPSVSNNDKSFDLHEIFKVLPSVRVEKGMQITTIVPDVISDEIGIWSIPDDILNKVLITLNPGFDNFSSPRGGCRMDVGEQNPEPLAHPLCKNFCTEDGSPLHKCYLGEIFTGLSTISDFCGVTALSLILKSAWSVSRTSKRVDIKWCTHKPDKSMDTMNSTPATVQTVYPCSSELSHNGDSVPSTRSSRKRGRLVDPGLSTINMHVSTTQVLKVTKNLKSARKNLMNAYSKDSVGSKRKRGTVSELSETWVQCDGCRKWRRLSDGTVLDSTTAWFCKESWDVKRKITYLPGFYKKGVLPGNEQNVSFFTNILKDNISLINSETKKALLWLAQLPLRKHLEMESVGLTRPVLDARATTGKGARPYFKLFQAFGLVRKIEKGVTRWYYPSMLDDLAFDSAALGIALENPLDLVRLYLSRATLIVVPANLIDHWTTQIQRHVSSDTLNVYAWGDHKRPPAHILAWDYDIVITTFSRLSAEWGPNKKSVLKQIHWFRVILDEGHTLGSSLALTNKLQMAVSLVASNRWILTGTPTPNTPTSQVAHLHPMLKFLHEEAYGENYHSWESGIHRPFEAQMEEGRIRLVELLRRSMISARKADLKNIPPCIKRITFVDFSEGHAKSYNELVVTIRRNILMADWNDPSHVESLLNPKQWKFRTTTIRNVRLSCCVAGHIKVAEAGHDIQETMDELMHGGLDPSSEEYQSIRFALLNGTDCIRCRDWCRLPVITPCRHLLCHDCVALDSEKCIECGNNYEMQSPETRARPENPNPKWPVPKDLIELQPSYKQDDWDPDWQSTTSSKVAYLIEKLRSLREANRKHLHSTNVTTGAGLANKSSYQDDNNPQTRLPQTLPDKVIIFSQFLEHIHVIEQQLTIAGITYAGMYSPMPLGTKRSALTKYKEDPTCMALLMDGTAALGLDLSFVNHVFLMEPIWDRSMEEQVINQAHRMGATRPINVETLAIAAPSRANAPTSAGTPERLRCRRSVCIGVGVPTTTGATTGLRNHDVGVAATNNTVWRLPRRDVGVAADTGTVRV